MTLSDKLNEDYKAAMKSGERIRIETLRLLKAQLKQEQIDKMRPLTPEEEMAVLSNAAKKRREAIDSYKQAGRDILLEKEMAELAIISSYLPQPFSPEELAQVIDAAIKETGAATAADLGRVMGKIMPQIKGRADGKLAQQMVRERLGG
ncbi:MAG: GatB/YqeY domain-containing protein [candidate division KSB1 bacterium]|nr:GatB/YqeY domain-containing protein [candidate division KSB1 bacterium]MDZ7365264.1 GatB/YqeY domain-containing protein [candidate division KSB1 bacterium]MDZ7403131.1 GatB/YqeY domain-containing protein [candidate division KSB1 bacterium]